MSDFTGEDAYRILLDKFTELQSAGHDGTQRAAELSFDLSSTQEALAETRDKLRRANNERDEHAKKSAEGEKLWKAANVLVSGPSDIIGLAENLKKFREIVVMTGDAGLDPDAIPF